MSNPPRNLDELRAIEDPIERARAVAGYITSAENKIAEARQLRRDAIAVLLEAPERAAAPTALAREIGVSVSTVKNVRDGRGGGA